MLLRFAALLIGCLAAPLNVAQASVFGETYTFYATFSSGAPYTSVSGMFDATYATGGNTVLSDFSSTLPVSFQSYQYVTGAQSQGIGTDCSGTTCSVSAGHDAFALSLSMQQNELPSQVEFQYSSSRSSGVFAANAVTFSITAPVRDGVSAVPLPASAPLFGAALLALGAVGYRRKKTFRRSDRIFG